MLLRSSSTPLFNSWLPHSTSKKSSLPEPEVHVLRRTISVCCSTACHSPGLLENEHTKRVSSFDNLTFLHETSVKKPKIEASTMDRGKGELGSSSITSLFPCSGLQEKLVVNDESSEMDTKCTEQTLVIGGVGSGGGGRIRRGGGGGSGSHGRDSTDAYYQKMIQSNPDNPLLLGNYARFLLEVQGDAAKAEEYCGKALLASPNDPSLLSLYADLIWKSEGDAERAESYFDLAVQTAPDDCFVLASYAKFLWDAEDEAAEHESNQGGFNQPEIGVHQTVWT